MSLSEKYELQGTTITVGLREVRDVFRFPEHDLPKLRAIAENWSDRSYITAKDLLKLEKAGMRRRCCRCCCEALEETKELTR
jgi:hypothetical protein